MFSWTKRRPKAKAEAPTAPAPEPGQTPLDTLGAVVRAWGKSSFDIDVETAEIFAARAEAWAQHILLGTPAPSPRGELPDSEAQPAPEARRDFGGLKKDMGERRKSERRFVTKAVSSLKGALLEVLDELRGSLAADASEDEELSQQLDQLKESLNTTSLDFLRANVTDAVHRIGEHVQSRRARQEALLSSMGDRMKAMRSDLVEAQTQSTTDALTGLRNRGALDAELPKLVMMSQISRDPLTVIMLDLDHFKQVNDSHGHDAGDAVLRAFSDELVRTFPRKSDLLCRYGGEEFCLVLPNASAEDAARLTERLLLSVRHVRVDHEGVRIRVTASAGIATLRKNEKAKSVLKRADAALYEAKEGGRDRAISAD